MGNKAKGRNKRDDRILNVEGYRRKENKARGKRKDNNAKRGEGASKDKPIWKRWKDNQAMGKRRKDKATKYLTRITKIRRKYFFFI